MHNMTLSRNLFLLLIILAGMALAVFFRFYNIGKMVYWTDESFTSLWISGHKWDEVEQTISGQEIKAGDVLKFQRVTPEKGVIDTIRALALCDPHHPPLYYVMLRAWAGMFGDSAGAVRSLSAVFSLMVFPFLFWLCLQLFESKKVAWIAVLLVAFSPFQVLYAREAREYSLWILTSVISCATLLYALKSKSQISWLLYAASVACGFYSYELFASMPVVHWLYIFSFYFSDSTQKFIPFVKSKKPFWVSSLFGIGAFSPWLYITFFNTPKVMKLLSWVIEPVEIKTLIARWAFNYSVLFFDVNKSAGFVARFSTYVLYAYLLQSMILILAAYAVFRLFVKKRQQGLLILLLTILPFLFLAVPDLIFGMWSSSVYRYLCPSLLGVQISVACLLGEKVENDPQNIWKLITFIILSCGIVSCILIVKSESWWTKPNDFHTPGLARIINQSNSPLVITLFSGKVLSLSRRLKPEIRILALEETEQIHVSNNYSDIYVYNPTPWLLKKVGEKFRGDLLPLDQKGGLWALKNFRCE
jgi:uncharacterized membrane protein